MPHRSEQYGQWVAVLVAARTSGGPSPDATLLLAMRWSAVRGISDRKLLLSGG